MYIYIIHLSHAGRGAGRRDLRRLRRRRAPLRRGGQRARRRDQRRGRGQGRLAQVHLRARDGATRKGISMLIFTYAHMDTYFRVKG